MNTFSEIKTIKSYGNAEAFLMAQGMEYVEAKHFVNAIKQLSIKEELEEVVNRMCKRFNLK
jgi:hypothetical protein